MYWLLVMRADLAAKPGDVNAVKGRTIGAAPLVELGLKQLLIDAGIDLERDDVRIVGVPGANEPGVSFGVAAAQALAERQDRRLLGQRHGRGKRRSPGRRQGDPRRAARPRPGSRLSLHDAGAGHERRRDRTRSRNGGGRTCAPSSTAQRALKADVGLATKVGRALFPPAEAALIADVVARDLPYYDPRFRKPPSLASIASRRPAGC